jgi:UDP-N-acetylmuramoyl-tripeptide--D-alanyl-D-alanine ligase
VFSHDDILTATGAQPTRAAQTLTCVSTDTRSMCAGALFVALKGARFDGHAFVGQAAEYGAGAVLVQEDVESSLPVYRVRDTLRAYQDLARFHCERMAIPIIGITGTNGKTTVRELITALLRQSGKPHASLNNENNHIGVPKTLLGLRACHTHGVVEMGMNHPGEIALLTRLAQPQVAAITSIGRGHLEFLHSVEAVAESKAEVFEGLRPGGVAVLPADSPYLDLLRQRAGEAGAGRIVTFGVSDESDVTFLPKSIDFSGTRGTLVNGDIVVDIELQLPGEHSGVNAAAAFAAVRAIMPELDVGAIQAALASVAPIEMRCEVLDVHGAQVVLDCYNANPESMAAALRLLATADVQGRRVAVLGEMLELGPAAAECHREVGRLAARLGIDTLIAIGVHAHDTARGARVEGMCPGDVHEYDQVQDAAGCVGARLGAGDVVVVKASRGMHLEVLIDELRPACPSAA